MRVRAAGQAERDAMQRYKEHREPTTPSHSVGDAVSADWELYPVWPADAYGVCTCWEREKCQDAGKHPIPRHGFNDATADPVEIAAMFSNWPQANLGLKTGRGSGVVVIDVDSYKGGGQSVARLQKRHGKLPGTRLHQTGSSDLHYLYAYPEGLGWLPSSTIAPGVEVKADGACVVLPPSEHASGRRYEILVERSLAPLPSWLRALALAPLLKTIEGHRHDAPATHSRFDLPKRILEGSRNDTMYRYGCSLRAHGWDHASILEELRRSNGERCVPSLGALEVSRIAASAAAHQPGHCSTPTAEVSEALDSIEAALWDHVWPGTGGLSERSVMVALIRAARRHGAMIPAGVRISLDYRALSLAAAMKISSAHRAVQRLRRKGWLRYDNEGRKPANSGAFVLVLPPREPEHSTTPSSPLKELGSSRETEMVSVPPCAPRLRWGGSLGKRCEQIVDLLEWAGGELKLQEVAIALGMKRQRDLRRRHIARLEEAGVVACAEEVVWLRLGWTEALERERTLSGEKRAENLDRAEYERQREAYRLYLSETATNLGEISLKGRRSSEPPAQNGQQQGRGVGS